MDFDLSEEKLVLREMVRRLAIEEIAPEAQRREEAKKFPRDLFRQLADLGLLGVFVPEQYGGAGGDNLDWVIALEEIACADPAISVSILGHCHAVRTLLMGGSEEQKQRYLEPIASGRSMAAFALTEPDAGSDAAAIRMRAGKDAVCYTLDGTKSFITNAGGVADVIVVAARTGPTLRGRSDGVSAFVLEADTPGFSFGRREDKMGIHASMTGDLLFEGCRVSHAHLIGTEGNAFPLIKRVFAVERMGNSAIAVGAAQGAFDHALQYARERKTFGRELTGHQGIRWMLADMAIQIQAARLLVYRGAVSADKGRDTDVEVAMAKCYANEMCLKVISDAIQILGAYGYTRDYPVEKLYRDARMLAMGGGTTQIMREIVGRHLSRLP